MCYYSGIAQRNVCADKIVLMVMITQIYTCDKMTELYTHVVPNAKHTKCQIPGFESIIM